MVAYRIRLYTEDGDVQEEQVLDCQHDDEAIDRVGEFHHPHAMDVWEGARHVARFPPWNG